MHRFLAASLFAFAAAGAHAQVLVSADNNADQLYSTYTDALYSLDGSHTALTFKTTKPNEVVIFSFNASRCGIQQTAQQTVSQLNESYISGLFYLDGQFVPTSTGNWFNLCYYNQIPQAQYMIQWGAAHMEQRITVPAPGTHTIGVLVGIAGSFNDGTGIYPTFGETHVEVRR